MHELGYATEIVSTLEDYMKENHLTEITSVTLLIGEATGVVPHYMEECWPAAIEGSALANAKLVIDFRKAQGRCRECDELYVISDTHGKCPKCGSEEYDFQNGYEFEISEIHAH